MVPGKNVLKSRSPQSLLLPVLLKGTILWRIINACHSPLKSSVLAQPISPWAALAPIGPRVPHYTALHIAGPHRASKQPTDHRPHSCPGLCAMQHCQTNQWEDIPMFESIGEKESCIPTGLKVIISQKSLESGRCYYDATALPSTGRENHAAATWDGSICLKSNSIVYW